jgi:adhesin isopeptide-forming family sspB-C2 type protein/fimbrial isopeptide formation D2 family protein
MRSSRTSHSVEKDRGSGASRRSLTVGRSRRKVVAGIALAGMAFGLIASGSPAIAAVGGGSTGGGGGSGSASDSYWLYTLDNYPQGGQPEQGWGPGSTDYFAAAMESQGQWASGSGPMNGTRSALHSSCNDAMAQASARSGIPGTKSRVVQVGVSVGGSGGQAILGWGGTKATMTSWYQGLTAANYWQGSLVDYEQKMLDAVSNEFLTNIPDAPRIVCVALNEFEPERQYELGITTDAQGTFLIPSGSEPVSDLIHATNGGSSIVENVNANVILHWERADGHVQQVSKSVSIANNGSTPSPQFTPADFGWQVWEDALTDPQSSGRFWYDVQVAQQGGMAAAVDTPDRDPRETWEVWKPNPNKDVIGSAEESGDKTHESINGLSVWPGQKLEYSVGIDLVVPETVRGKITSFAVQDSFDPQFSPDKTSVQFWDSRDAKNPKPVARSAYKLAWDADANSFTATFTDAWVKDNLVGNTAQGWLTMRFTGQVKDTTAPGSTVKNQAFQIVNGVKVATTVPEVKIPTFTPDKEDLNTDLIDIDGKTVLLGDTILYRLTMDATPGRDELAYNVHKLGMVDDYDEEYLKADTADIRIANQATGEDVTGKFNIQILDGVVYTFAKTVDTTLPTGDTVAGDPQPANLKEYDAAPIDPLKDPIIDQALMGHKYWVTIPTKVIKTTDGYVIENQARQNLQNTHRQTKIVSNPLKEINPDKDVVVSAATGDKSIDGATIPLNDVFNYRLNSSEIPGNRAYDASTWSLSDTFDRVHDSYTGIWAVHASADLYDGDTRVAKKGDLLANSDSFTLDGHGDLFTVTFDEATYTLRVSATPAYLTLVNSRGDLAQAFSVYTKMVRIAPAEKVENKTIETYNGEDRESNIVWTTTPENPAIDVEKFTLSEGLTAGDRDKADQAYEIPKHELTAGTVIGIRVTNTGDVPLRNVTLTDKTHQGLAGTVTGIICVDGTVEVAPESIGDLAVGESIDCQGILTGVKDGQLHGDTATVTGESIFTGKKVTEEDPWFAKTPGALAATGGEVAGGIVLGGGLLLGALLTVLARRRRAQASVIDGE